MQEIAANRTNLNEEELQTITGGCDRCVADQNKVDRLQREAEQYRAESHVATNRRDMAEAMESHRLSVQKSREAVNLLARIVARHL